MLGGYKMRAREIKKFHYHLRMIEQYEEKLNNHIAAIRGMIEASILLYTKKKSREKNK